MDDSFEVWPIADGIRVAVSYLHRDSRASICSGFLYVAVSITAVDTNRAVNTNIKSSLGNRGSKMLAM